MATLAANNPTLMDVAKQIEPDGGVTTDIVEMCQQDNEVLLDATVQEANNFTSHRSTIRTGIPTPTWRQFYQGVDPGKSTYAQVDEPMGMMEARSVIDKDLADLDANKDQLRLNEAAGHIEGMNQTMVQSLFYGNVATNPQGFNGLSMRFNDDTTAATKENIVTGGGSGSDNTSIWLIGWSPRTVFLTYPKGSQAGLQRVDNGLQEVTDSNGKRFTAYEDKFTWKCGLVVKDWRYVVRIPNIDVSNLVGETSAADILKLMTKAVMTAGSAPTPSQIIRIGTMATFGIALKAISSG